LTPAAATEIRLRVVVVMHVSRGASTPRLVEDSSRAELSGSCAFSSDEDER